MKDATMVYNYLVNNGIIVRNRSNQVHCDNCLRITIGTAKENNVFIKYLEKYDK
jgi:histidinol-phosphate aminotransferase